MGNHSIKFGIDVRRAYNLRVPSDRHRSGELNFENDRTRGPAGGGLALASFMLGDVTRFTRYVSPTTDARERQWRHFYYAQDVFRPTPKLTLNYGLRLDVINPQTVNEAGQRRVSRSRDRPDQRRRRGRHRIERQRREHVQLGASPRRDLPAHREDGPPRRLRQKLRHRRLRIAVRPQRHPEPAGAVGAGAERAATTSTACSTSRRAAPAPRVPGGSGERPVRAAGRRVRARAAGQAAAAARRRVQRHGAAPVDGDDLGRGGIRRQPRRQRVRGRRPGHQRQPGDPDRLPDRVDRSAPAVLRRQRAEHAPGSAAPSAGRRASITSATAPPTPTTRCRPGSPSASRAATRCWRATRCSARSRTTPTTSSSTRR